MIRTRSSVPLLAVALGCVFGLAFACGEEPPAGCEGACACEGGDCICPDEGDCAIECTADCDLQCAGAGACDFVCPELCNVRCTGNAPCVAAVGDDSTATCPGNGPCDIACAGDCTVTCTMGTCTMRCLGLEEGATCELTGCSGNVTECPTHPDNVTVCGGPCPPDDE